MWGASQRRRGERTQVPGTHLVPVVVVVVRVAVERLEAGSSGDGDVEGLGGEERLGLKEVEVVAVGDVAEKGAPKAVEGRHLREFEVPELVRAAVDVGRVEEGFGVVEPLEDRRVLVLVELKLDRLEGLRVEDVVAVVERRLLVVEGREAHALEVAPIALLAPHREPHGRPLGVVNGRHDGRDLVDEGDGSRDVVDDRDLTDLLPRHLRPAIE